METGEPTLVEQTPLALDAATVAELARDDPALPGRLADVALWEIAYRSEGLLVRGMLAHPRGAARSPCLIYNRGGTGAGGALTPADAAGHLARIASWGYLVIASQYRGAPGCEGHDEFGGRDLQDVLALLPLLDRMPLADGGRIGMWGWSRGGLMTYQALGQTERIAAAVVVAGVADAFDYMERRPDMERQVFAEQIPRYWQEREAALLLRSPARWPKRICPRTAILLLHGTDDWRVHPGQSLAMAQALLRSGHPLRLVLFEGGDHSLSQHREEHYRLARDWLDRYVRG